MNDAESASSLEVTAAHEFTPGSEASGAHGRLFFLDSLRAFAALYVVIGHIALTVYAPWHPLEVLLEFGDLSVALFIVVSGFSLGIAAKKTRDKRYRTFIRRRAWRIIPPYWAALVVSLVLIKTLIPHPTGTIWDSSVPLSHPGTGIAFVLVQDIFPNFRFPDYVVWSIAVEWHLYFFFPLLLWVASRRRGRALVLALGALATVLLTIPWNDLSYSGFPPQFAFLFIVGIVASTITSSEDTMSVRVRQLLRPSVATGLGAGCLVLAALLDNHWTNDFAGDVVFGIGAAVLIIAYTGAPDFQGRRALEWRPIVWLGFFSYSLYLIHAPLIQVTWQYLVNPLHLGKTGAFLLTMFLGLIVSIVGAFLFHLICERPFINYRSLKGVLAAYRDPRGLFVRTERVKR